MLLPFMNPDIQKAFHEAVSNNDVETARRMIAAGADVNAPYDEYENRSFLDACYKGNLDLVKLLVKAGADVNLPDSCGTAPLVRAIVSIHDTDEVVKYLIDCGADVNACAGESWTPLEAAIQEHAADIVKILLDAGANPRVSSEKREASLLTASDWGDVDIVEMLLEAGADPNSYDDDNYTPLAAACRWGHAEAAELLLKFGANPHTSDSCYNDSILMDAAEGNNPKCIKMLLERNVDVNHVNFDDETALLYAVLHPNNEKIVSMLLEAGANPNITGGELGSPLSIVMHDKEFRSAEILIKFGAKFSNNEDYYTDEVLENIDDHTLFYNLKDNGIVLRTDDEAVILYAKHACSYLLRKALGAGANPNATDSTGKSALAWALEHPRHPQGCAARLIRNGATFAPTLLIRAIRLRQRELVTAILERKIDVDTTDERGCTALHYSARMGKTYFISALISKGANIEFRNKSGYTPLLLALRYRNTAAAQVLIEQGADTLSTGGKHNEDAYMTCIRYHIRLSDFIRTFACVSNNERISMVLFNYLQESIWGEEKNVQSESIEELRKRGISAKEGTWALCSAAYKNNTDLIHKLVEMGADVNATDKSHWQEFPLASAAEKCNVEAVKLLLDYGADATKENSWALWAAVNSTETEFMPVEKIPPVAKLLLEAGADPNAPWYKNDRWTLLQDALDNNCEELALLLLEHGANIKSPNGGSLTWRAYGMPRVMNELIRLGMRGDDVVREDNMTFLMEAVWNKDAQTVKTLLELGANVSAKDDNGMTALDYAIQENAQEVIQVLRTYTSKEESH